MKNHYKIAIKINSPCEKVFNAISKNLGDWWGKPWDHFLEQALVTYLDRK